MAKRQNRTYLIQTYGHLYKKFFPEDPGCFYCGDDFQVYDHCPPLAWIESRKASEWRKQQIPMILVPSCSSCNSHLNDKPHMTVLDRLLFLESLLSKKIEEALALWSEEEIAEMSPMFQKQIRAKQQNIKFLAARLHGVQERLLDRESHPRYSDYS